MNSPAHDLALFLSAQAIGVWETDIFVGHEPDTPDNCLTIYDTGGGERDTDEMDISTPTVQMRARATTYTAAYAKLDAIMTLFASINSFTSGTSRFTGVILQSDVASLGRDENKRHLLTVNFRCRRSAA